MAQLHAHSAAQRPQLVFLICHACLTCRHCCHCLLRKGCYPGTPCHATQHTQHPKLLLFSCSLPHLVAPLLPLPATSCHAPQHTTPQVPAAVPPLSCLPRLPPLLPLPAVQEPPMHHTHNEAPATAPFLPCLPHLLPPWLPLHAVQGLGPQAGGGARPCRTAHRPTQVVLVFCHAPSMMLPLPSAAMVAAATLFEPHAMQCSTPSCCPSAAMPASPSAAIVAAACCIRAATLRPQARGGDRPCRAGAAVRPLPQRKPVPAVRMRLHVNHAGVARCRERRAWRQPMRMCFPLLPV